MYTYTEAEDHPDLDLRYSVLCQAALAAPVLLDDAAQDSGGSSPRVQPHTPVVFVANDWPTAPLLLRLQYSIRDAASRGVSTGPAPLAGSSSDGLASLQQLLAERLAPSALSMFCIHNLAYQGVLPAEAFARLCLPQAALPALCTSADWREVLRRLQRSSELFGGIGGGPDTRGSEDLLAPAAVKPQHRSCARDVPSGFGCTRALAAGAAAVRQASRVESSDDVCTGAAAQAAGGTCPDGHLNQMRAALLTADCLVTVSQGYAVEVQQHGQLGCGMSDILAARGIR